MSDPGKQATNGGTAAGEPFAALTNGDELIAALRERMAAIGVCYALVEHLAGMAKAPSQNTSAARVRGN
jgi:hypothetical protein